MSTTYSHTASTMKLQIAIFIFLYMCELSASVRPAYEDNTELCAFLNWPRINGRPAEMTKEKGNKYFRRTRASREEVTAEKAISICRMYNLEAAEILDQDDYDEVVSLVNETGREFWIAIQGKYMPQDGNYHFDFTLADGETKIGFHDFGAKEYDKQALSLFKATQTGCVTVGPNPHQPSGVSWLKVPCIEERHDILCQYKKSCYMQSDFIKDPTRPIRRLQPMLLPGEEETGYFISTMQATWPFAKQVCEDAKMSLIWFENDADYAAFQERMDKFAADKSQYNGKSYWTAGRFSPVEPKGDIYGKLYWWKHNVAHEAFGWDLHVARSGVSEGSGGFEKTWGMEMEALDVQRREPYDEGLNRKEACVDATFTEDGQFFTSKCEKSLRYFVCRNPEIVKRSMSLKSPDSPKPSFLDYCDGERYQMWRRKECNGEVLFSGQTKPDCICYNGV